MDQHSIVSALKELALELGRIPEMADTIGRGNLYSSILTAFGSHSVAIKAAGLNRRPVKEKKIVYKTNKLQGHIVHELKLRDLFDRAGNPYVLRGTFQSDTHIPNHDPKALGAYLKFLEWYKPHFDLIGGDLMDMAPMSHWPSDDAKPRRFKDDRRDTIDFLLKKIQILGDHCKTKIYLSGNHEDWLNQALAHKVPEFYDGMEGALHLKELLHLDDIGYDWIGVNEFLKIGKLFFTHGLYTSSGHAKKHLDQLKCSIVYGHLHDTQTHNQTSISGSMESFSTGCLCKLDAPFLKGKPNNWVHSFGVIEIFRNGDFNVVLPRIRNGLLTFGKRIFKA